MNLISEYQLRSKITLNTTLGVGPVLLAAVPDPYLFKGRNYDYISGVGVSGSEGFNIDNKLYFAASYRGGWLTTINGNSSHYFLHTVSGEVKYEFAPGLSFCAEPGYLTLEGNYKNHEDVDKKYPYLRASFRYNVNL